MTTGTGAKFKAKPVTIDGYHFASKAEAHRYGELRLLQRAEHISGLVVHPAYALHVHSIRGDEAIRIGEYRADFAYVKDGVVVVEDVKAPPSRTPIYKWKIKHLRAEYGITVTEIT